MQNNLWIMRVMALISGCLCTLVAGLQLSLPIFLNAVKDTFQLYQIDVEILSGLFVLGGGIIILPGIVFDRYGSFVCNIAGAVFLCLGFGFILSSIINPSFYLHKVTLLSIYFFLAGHGSAYLHLSATSVNILNFPDKHRGKVAMFLDIFFSCSPIVFSPLCYQVFVNNHYGKMSEVDLKGFFWFLFGLSLFTSLAAILAMPYVGYDNETIESSSQSNGKKESKFNLFSMQPIQTRGLMREEFEENTPILSGKDCGESENHGRKWRKCLNFRFNKEFSSCLKSRNYQLIIWTTAFMGGICDVILGNITTFSRSLHVRNMDMYLSLGPALFGVLVHIVLGPVSDLMNVMPGAKGAVIFGANVSLLCCLITFLITVRLPAPNRAAAGLMVSTCLAQVGHAGLSFANVIYSECWSNQHLGKLIGVAQVIQNIVGLILQTIFGMFYDLTTENSNFLFPTNISSTNSSLTAHDKNTTCYGEQCFRWSTFVNIIVNLLALTLNMWYLVEIRQKKSPALEKDDNVEEK